MKKLMTILVLFALCGVAMAQGVTGTSSAAAQYPITDNQGKPHPYVNYQTETEQGFSGLSYTVSNSFHPQGYDKDVRMGHVYFTTMSQTELAANNKNTDKVTVQFVGAQWDKSGNTTPWKGEYGIYLLEDANDPSKYMSVSKYNNTFELNPGQSFGVYYAYDTTKTVYDGRWDFFGHEETETHYVTSTGGYIGNFDTGIKYGEHKGQNEIIVYSTTNPEGTEDYTFKKFMCLFPDEYDNPKHWEFMLQTKLDDTAVIVNPDDVPTGQPLPGTLATLLIGGLCAGSLRKRNKK